MRAGCPSADLFRNPTHPATSISRTKDQADLARQRAVSPKLSVLGWLSEMPTNSEDNSSWSNSHSLVHAVTTPSHRPGPCASVGLGRAATSFAESKARFEQQPACFVATKARFRQSLRSRQWTEPQMYSLMPPSSPSSLVAAAGGATLHHPTSVVPVIPQPQPEGTRAPRLRSRLHPPSPAKAFAPS